MNLRLCLPVEISSLRLFSVAMWGLVNRKNFSEVQRLQGFVRFVYGFALAMIFQATVKSLPSSFNFHRCLLSSVCGGGLNSSWCVYPLFLNASWYGGAALLKTALSDKMLDSRWLIAAGMFLMILGGWLNWL